MISDKQLLAYARQYYAGHDFRLGKLSLNSVFRTLRGCRVVLFTNCDNKNDYVTLNEVKRLI